MRLFLLLLVNAALALRVVAAAPVNFKVITVIDGNAESLDRPRPCIAVGTWKISFTPPPFAELRSEADSLSLYFSKPEQKGQLTVTNSPYPPSADLLANINDYHRAAEATIPAAAEGVEFKGMNNRLYRVNDFTSVAFDWSYKLYGRPTRRQVAYLNLDPEHQVCLTILCDEENAPATLAAARRFMNSWYWADALEAAAK